MAKKTTAVPQSQLPDRGGSFVTDAKGKRKLVEETIQPGLKSDLSEAQETVETADQAEPETKETDK